MAITWPILSDDLRSPPNIAFCHNCQLMRPKKTRFLLFFCKFLLRKKRKKKRILGWFEIFKFSSAAGLKIYKYIAPVVFFKLVFQSVFQSVYSRSLHPTPVAPLINNSTMTTEIYDYAGLVYENYDQYDHLDYLAPVSPTSTSAPSFYQEVPENAFASFSDYSPQTHHQAPVFVSPINVFAPSAVFCDPKALALPEFETGYTHHPQPQYPPHNHAQSSHFYVDNMGMVPVMIAPTPSPEPGKRSRSFAEMAEDSHAEDVEAEASHYHQLVQLPMSPDHTDDSDYSKAASPEAEPEPTEPCAKAQAQVPVTESSCRRGRKPSDHPADAATKTFVCQHCSRRFRRQEHLKRHFRSLHTREKPFECNKCGKTFSRSDNLAQHARTHVRGGEEEPVTGSGGVKRRKSA